MPMTPNASGLNESRRWTIVGLLFAASLINYFDRATLSFALPSLSKDLGLGPAAKGTLLSAFFWSYALMQIPMGWLADRKNLRWVYAGAFVLWSVAQGLTGFATTMAMLIFFRVLLGVGEAIYLPGGTKIVSLLFPPGRRGLPAGLFDAGTRTGLVMEGLLVPWMLEHYGWPTTFRVIGFTALLWLIPWFLATPRQLRGPARPPAKFDPGLILKKALLLVRNRNLVGICLGFFFFDYYWFLLVNWLPDYLQTVRHLSGIKAGLHVSLPFLVFAACQPLGGWIADRLVRAGYDETLVRKGIITAAFLTGLFLIPTAHAQNATSATLFVTLGALVGLSAANMLVMVQSYAPRDEVGLWTGVYNFIGNLAGALAPIVTGYIIKWTGSYTPAFVLAAVAIAAAQLSFWLIVGPIPRSEEKSSDDPSATTNPQISPMGAD